MAEIIGFVSEKGGVGKTTALYHIAVGLSRFHDKRVLVVDTDYQRGGLTCRLRSEMLEDFRMGEVNYVTIYHIYRTLYSGQREFPELDILDTGSKNSSISLIAADPRLNSISVDKMPPTNNLRDNNKMLLKHLTLIKDCLAQYEEQYDFILIDSHPDLHDLEKSVICASDYIISPVKFDQQSSVGVPSTREAIYNVDEDISVMRRLIEDEFEYTETEFLGAMGMMCREYGGTLKYSEQLIYNRLRRTTGVFNTYVTEGDGIRQASQESCSVFSVSGNNAERQSQQFKDLINEVLEKT